MQKFDLMSSNYEGLYFATHAELNFFSFGHSLKYNNQGELSLDPSKKQMMV